MHATTTTSLNEKTLSIHWLSCFLLFVILGLGWTQASSAEPARSGSLFAQVEGAEKSTDAGEQVLRTFRVELPPELVQRDLPTLDEIVVDLPDGYFASARFHSLEQRRDGYTWRGRLSGESSDGLARGGDMVLSVIDGQLGGVWFDGAEVYQFLPDGEGGHRLHHIDPQYFEPCATDDALQLAPASRQVRTEVEKRPTAPASQPPFSLEGDPRMSLDKALIQLDVMVLYTPAARNAAGGLAAINTLIQNAVDITNTAYANSGIQARLRLAHHRQIEYTEGDFVTSLNWLSSNFEVADLRDRYGADMVSMISNDPYFCGIGSIQRAPNELFFSKHAFQVTQWTCAVGNLSFAHEFGHNQGCEHDPANGSPSTQASYPYSYGHYNDGSYRTVMAYSNQCTSYCARVPYFSNPNVSYSGRATGIANSRENYRTINNTAGTMSTYRSAPDWLMEDSFESGGLGGWTVVTQP